MKRILIIATILIACGSITYSPVFANHQEVKEVVERTSLSLTKKLQRLLSAEMNAVQNAMINLSIAIPAGDWGSVTSTAGSIRDGYIMENKLSENEMMDFRKSLPAGYVKIDQAYKQLAEEMVDAAKKGDADAVNMTYYKINSACIECHVKYAKDRFPGFRTVTGDE